MPTTTARWLNHFCGSLKATQSLSNLVRYFCRTALVQFLSRQQEAQIPDNIDEVISMLMQYLRQHRCLLVLDNAEAILQGGLRAGYYREGYEDYGRLFQQVAQMVHQSCLVLTSREKLREIKVLEGDSFPVRSLQLQGLTVPQGRDLLQSKSSFSGSEPDWNVLVKHYAGNPLALKIVAPAIQEFFSGNVSEFVHYVHQDLFLFDDIRDLLGRQFNRLSASEQQVMYWLAINREWVSLTELEADLLPTVAPGELLEILDSLLRRSLIEKATPTLLAIRSSNRNATNMTLFTLQPVVMEYVIERLIERLCEEISTQRLNLFQFLALQKATAKDYVRETQIRLILQPIITKLLRQFKAKTRLEQKLLKILETLRQECPHQPGYAGGNILNLLCRMQTDLNGYDFSHLSVWQASLQSVTLHNANFAYADLSMSTFAETFGGVLSVAFSPNGILAMGDSNSEIRLYQVVNGKQILTCKGHTDWITSLSFSPNGKTLASGSNDDTVKLWDVSTGKCLQTWKGHDKGVDSVAFSPNGNRLATSGDDHVVRLWDMSTGKCLRTFHGHSNWVLAVAFSLDGQTLFSGSDDDTIRLWDVDTGKCLRIFYGHLDGIRSIALNPQGMLASASDDKTVRLWDVRTGACLRILHGHTNQVCSVAFSPNGQTLASGSNDWTMRLWDVSTGECLKTFQGHSSWIYSVAFSPASLVEESSHQLAPQDNILASGSHDQSVRLWDVRTGECLRTFQGYSNQVYAVAFSPRGDTLASGGHDQSVRLWDVRTGECLRIQGHSNKVYAVAFSPSGTLISGSGDRTIRLWHTITGECLRTFQGHQAAIWSVAFSPDGQTFVSGSEDQTVRLWNIATGQTLRIFQGHNGWIWSVAFSPKGMIVASGALDQTIKLWDVSTGECLKTLAGHAGWVYAVAFSSDGELLVSASSDQTLRIWSVHSGECLRILEGDASWLQSLVFSSDNQILAFASDHTVKLCDVSTGECFQTLQGHKSWVWSIAFSPDNQTLASSSDDETVRLWDTRTGCCLKTFSSKKSYEGMKITGVTGIAEATIATLKALGE